ncbi:hypothetical protein KFU94_33255 [Chloroflexi bacterium TSY]|nr:hypothetical protein [Chloroflexi bacterium TSY]
MRKFSSYGPVSKISHYYVPRTELVAQASRQLMGENPDEGGHYNIQRSVHIPNLTEEEVAQLFAWYMQESDQTIEDDVIELMFHERATYVLMRSSITLTFTLICYGFSNTEAGAFCPNSQPAMARAIC